jgi:hypothetical protein
MVVLHTAADPTTLQRPQAQPVWQAGLQSVPALGGSAQIGVCVGTGQVFTASHLRVIGLHANPSGQRLPASAQMKPWSVMLGL